MMQLCNETITVINKRYDPAEDRTVYAKTVITGASWFGSLKSNVDSSGLKAANQYVVRVDAKTADFGGKAYLDPVAFEKISVLFRYDDAQARYDFATYTDLDAVTFANGDLIVRGEVTEADEDITPELIHKNYAEVLTVLSVTDNRRTQNAPHWKVVGA